MMERCKECYEDSIVSWRSHPYNEAIREYVESYVSPPKIYYQTIEQAMAAWGEETEDGREIQGDD